MGGETTSELRSWLAAIGTLTAAVNGDRDLASLLDLVAATAQTLLDLSFCAVMLPDDDGEYLAVAGASGLPDEYIARINREHAVRLETNATTGAPASRAFRSGRPTMVSDVAAEPPSSWTKVATDQGYRSILAVPLLASSTVIGTLNSYRVTPHHFTSQEIEQLELLAEHATIALTSARILDDLREKHELIARSEEIHERLLSVAVRSGGVPGIASALNELLSRDVVIRDSYGSTLAAEPHPVAGAHHIEAVASSQRRTQSGASLVRRVDNHLAADVVLEGAVVATVWLLDGADDDLDPLTVRALEHASVVVSLELLRQRTAAEVEQSLRGELLADLLAGADPQSQPIRDRAGLMGHNLALPHVMLVASPIQAPGSPRPRRAPVDEVELAQRAVTEAVRLTSHLRPRPLIAAVRGVVVALWPESVDLAKGEQALRRAISSAHDGAAASMAMTRLDRHGIPAAYRGARGALAFAAADGDSRSLVTLDDLGAAGLLLQYADPAELRRYTQRTIGVLRKYDADHGTELFKTLRAYLNCDLDRKMTADLLVLHPNTVSQRLRRIETLTSLNLRSPRAVIEARTACLLADVADASADRRPARS
ncbi:helix-turn-helix domain-containing protein [Nocardioides sp. AN3]